MRSTLENPPEKAITKKPAGKIVSDPPVQDPKDSSAKDESDEEEGEEEVEDEEGEEELRALKRPSGQTADDNKKGDPGAAAKKKSKKTPYNYFPMELPRTSFFDKTVQASLE